jgi:hypothetical protein
MAGRKKVRKVVNEFGPAPTSVATKTDLLKAYQWYHSSYDHKDAVKALRDYVKQNPEHAVIAKLEASAMPTAVGIQAKMVLDGLTLPRESVDHFEFRLLELAEKADGVIAEPVAAKGPVVSAAREKLGLLMAELDDATDKFVDSNMKGTFSAYDFLKSQGASGPMLNKIQTYVAGQSDELNEAVAGTCEQLNEAYGCYTRPQLKKFADFMSGMIADIQTLKSGKLAVRAPRKVRVKKVIDALKGIAPLAEHKDLKIASVSPASLIGNRLAYVYLVKKNAVLKLVASEDAGLHYKGKSLTGFNIELSGRKAVRKRYHELADLAQVGKISAKRTFDKFPGKLSELVSDKLVINDSVILLKGFK